MVDKLLSTLQGEFYISKLKMGTLPINLRNMGLGVPSQGAEIAILDPPTLQRHSLDHKKRIELP